MTASALRPRVCEIRSVTSKSGVSTDCGDLWLPRGSGEAEGRTGSLGLADANYPI